MAVSFFPSFYRGRPLNFNYFVTKGYKWYREAIRYDIVILGKKEREREREEKVA